jgi:hypothetical protein
LSANGNIAAGGGGIGSDFDFGIDSVFEVNIGNWRQLGDDLEGEPH